MSKDDAKFIHYHIARWITLGMGLSLIYEIVNSSKRESLLYGIASSYFLLRARHYDKLIAEELD